MNQKLMELERALSHIRLSLDERAEEMKQEYESTLTLLEAEFLSALMSDDWSEFDRFVNEFRNSVQLGASGDELTTPTAGSSKTTNKTIIKD
ncbi:MAG: hypothetical protein KME25_33135 [Symplocastrum torsivum CPER-KK1]|jgi:hypothetical protein|uniref:Uncharacterized protein n=1 Tax=Symplocastrum torsivum CPER-KK1 TaxID=450513 RepID=A0A951PTQ1_9CYAN|nr:hypothetical protein [Symplocastrum torsivum CPER-KK1]